MRPTKGRHHLPACVVARRLWCSAPRRNPRLTCGQILAGKWANISEIWYCGSMGGRGSLEQRV